MYRDAKEWTVEIYHKKSHFLGIQDSKLWEFNTGEWQGIIIALIEIKSCTNLQPLPLVFLTSKMVVTRPGAGHNKPFLNVSWYWRYFFSSSSMASLVAQMVKDSACNEGDQGLIPGTGRFPGEGKGYPLQYSCLENSTKRGAWQATVLGVAKSRTQLSN